jgi:hypothetical protein
LRRMASMTRHVTSTSATSIAVLAAPAYTGSLGPHTLAAYASSLGPHTLVA